MERLLIIGGTGSLGTCLIKEWQYKYKIYVISRDENKQWVLKRQYPNIIFIIGDMRDDKRMTEKIYSIKPHKVIIAAAMKHIDICEENVSECIQTNIIGVQNIVDTIVMMADQGMIPEMDSVCYISTDKATSPVNVYGMAKAIGERIMVEKSLLTKKPKFVIVRYGNIFDSRGSVIPLFNEIGKDPNRTFFPVTHPEMTRFILKLEEAINLIETAIMEGESGDTFIPKLESFKIIDIANYFSQKYNKPTKITQVRPGEKLHECLINESEKHRTISKDGVYIIKPCYKPIVGNVDFQEYTSGNSLSNKSFEE